MHFPSNISPALASGAKSGSEMTCQVDGNRRRSAVGKGLVVPCVYVFIGKPKHLDRLISVFAKLEVPSQQNDFKTGFSKSHHQIYKRFVLVLIVNWRAGLCTYYVRARAHVYYVQSIYLVGGGLIIEANVPVQELEVQRGEGAYFQRGLIFGRIRYTIREGIIKF